MTNEENIWILLRFLFSKYQSYYSENFIRVDVIVQYNSIFERIIFLKLEDKIKDHELELIHEYLENEIFSKLFFNKLFETIIEDDRKIEYKINHIFGGVFKVAFFYFIFLIS
jgi:hypothetical protein